MRGILGYIRWDGHLIDHALLKNLAFQSPLWKPDHQASIMYENAGFVTTSRYVTKPNNPCLDEHKKKEHGYVLFEDAYLTNRNDIISKLHASNAHSDAELLMLAYIKWQEHCTQHLHGNFCFAIWDIKRQQIFLAVDQFASKNFFYSFIPGVHFIFANYMTPFKILCKTMTINYNFFAHFSLDTLPQEQTSFLEVKKIQSAHYINVTKEKLKKTCYWCLKDNQNTLIYPSRDEYYQHFNYLFEKATQSCLRSTYSIASHISGGLDSSSVASMAASLLNKKNRELYGFTAISKDMHGPSYRTGWLYNEPHCVQAILDKYPNIKHHEYTADPTIDLFQQLEKHYPLIDQPIRNIFNFSWILASYDYMLKNNCRVLLTGGKGNASISWPGQSWKAKIYYTYNAAKIWLRPHSQFSGYYNCLQRKFIHTASAKKILRKIGCILDRQYFMLSETSGGARKTSAYPIQLWYGVEKLDPTNNLELIEFCYSLPQTVFFSGSDILQHRLLVREGLRNIVPEIICMHPYRGEQAADWYLSFNNHAKYWCDELLKIDASQHLSFVWDMYNKNDIFRLFEHLPIEHITAANTRDVSCALMRFLSMIFYLNFITCASGGAGVIY